MILTKSSKCHNHLSKPYHSKCCFYENHITLLSAALVYENHITLLSAALVYENPITLLSAVLIYQNHISLLSAVLVYQNRITLLRTKTSDKNTNCNKPLKMYFALLIRLFLHQGQLNRIHPAAILRFSIPIHKQPLLYFHPLI